MYVKQRLSQPHLKLVMKCLNVILHSLNQLCLVLTNGTSDVWPNEQSIESGEDPEHLIGILGGSQLITQARSDTCLHPVNALIIPNKELRL